MSTPASTPMSSFDKAYQAELEDFRQTKAKMDREQKEWEDAQKKIRDEKEAAEKKVRNELLQRKEALPYSDHAAQEICERIAVGELLINICEDAHLPTMRRTNQWIREHPAFNMLYQSAINDRLSVFEEQVIAIADDMRHDFRTVIKNGQEKRVPDPDMVARAKLRIDVRFRHLKAGRPQKWGDSTTIITKSDDPFDTSNLSADQLEQEIAAIESKSRMARVA
jgi:hypothetical protein